MPSVWLTVEDCQKGNLPGFCLACGQRTDLWVEQDFRRTHAWANPLSLFNPPLLIRVPACEEHCHYWRDRFCKLVVCLAASLVFFVLGSVLSWFLSATFLLFVLAVVVFQVTLLFRFRRDGIRALEISEQRIRLANVSSEFRCAYEMLRETGTVDLDRAASQGWNAARPEEQVSQDPPRPWCDAYRVRDEDELESSSEHRVLDFGPRE
jgi:hypothetical protein